MENKELIDRSPIRTFESITNGGIKAGEIGAITSKKGLGKTSVLVQLGMDYLLQDKKIVHLSFDQKSDNAFTWYEDIFAEITKRKNIVKPDELKESLLKNRILLNFNQDIISGKQIVGTLEALSSGGIKIEGLVIDGLDFTKVTDDTIKVLKDYAKKAKIVVWFGVSTDETDIKKMFKPDLEKIIDAVLYLEQKPDSIQMQVLKIRGDKVPDSSMKLDSKTLLLAEK
ncbi:MAG: hypothetical protein SPI86_08410 [Treponemataceae bacterium]|nr:hypothetical protein [Spirochaetales bacterium]MDY6031765.1 hypothetical protein [Treponemataceae bacterium]